MVSLTNISSVPPPIAPASIAAASANDPFNTRPCSLANNTDEHNHNDPRHCQQSYKHYSRRKYLPIVISLVIILLSSFLPAHVKSTSLYINPNHSSYDASKYFENLVRSKRESVAALYSGLPSARSGNAAIYFDQTSSSNNVNSNEILYSVDNRKPAFKNCAGYKPSVKEEQPENTYVIMVEAEDPDPDQEIKYSLVQSAAERPKFRINPTTGVIVTEHTFDRDEPIHEKAVYVTVQVTDNGRPPLDDVCTFKVTIEDINDNPPVFNKARYEESMSEDKQVSLNKKLICLKS